VRAAFSPSQIIAHHSQDPCLSGARIKLRKLSKDQRPLLDALLPSDPRLDFCMCNPPFFADLADAHGAAHLRSCAGNPDELVTDGGERRFAQRLIDDSAALRPRVRWFSCMLGHRASLRALATAARRAGAARVETTEFFQGQTVRWGLAWSFDPPPPPAAAHRFAARRPATAVRAAVSARLRAAGVAFGWVERARGTDGGGGGEVGAGNGGGYCGEGEGEGERAGVEDAAGVEWRKAVGLGEVSYKTP
jgi:hypothetical protein